MSGDYSLEHIQKLVIGREDNLQKYSIRTIMEILQKYEIRIISNEFYNWIIPNIDILYLLSGYITDRFNPVNNIFYDPIKTIRYLLEDEEFSVYMIYIGEK